RLHPAAGEDLLREASVGAFAFEHPERLAHAGQVVLGKRAGVGTRIGEQLVPFVEGLRDRERGARRVAEARVRLALQAGEVEERRRELRARLRLLGDGARLVAAALDDRLGALALPDALGARVGSGFRALEGRVEPATLIGA